MLVKIVYLLMRWSFGLIALVFRGDHAKDAELLVLRHENAVLRRQIGLWVPECVLNARRGRCRTGP